jgi:hypothetical protein
MKNPVAQHFCMKFSTSLRMISFMHICKRTHNTDRYLYYAAFGEEKHGFLNASNLFKNPAMVTVKGD